jgi:membrane protease YdiL (CAAX protease family)
MFDKLKLQRADRVGIAVFLALWGGSTAYLGVTGADWTFPLVALGIFSIGLSGVGWLTTRGANVSRVEVRQPGRESAALLVYMVVYAIVFLGWGMGVLREAIPAGRGQEVAVLAAKLGVHVVLPALLLIAVGANIKPLFRSELAPRIFWRTLLVLGAILLALLAVVSPGLQQISEVNPSFSTLLWMAPASYVWLALEAGFVEEFLFRGLLQTRLTAWFNSAWTGVIVTSILFGLAHAPGLFLRGGPDVDGWSSDPIQVIAYTIATLVPISLFFGFLYARTRSLLLVVLLHATVDFLPNMAEFIRTWG